MNDVWLPKFNHIKRVINLSSHYPGIDSMQYLESIHCMSNKKSLKLKTLNQLCNYRLVCDSL